MESSSLWLPARIVPASIVVVAVLAVAVACGGSSSTGSEATEASSRGPIPAPLATLEADSEDVIDQVPGGNWSAIAHDVTHMQATWSTYEAEATVVDSSLASRLGLALGALSRASRARNARGTVQSANDFSAPVVELFARYDLPYPVQIGRLDVIGRQIVIDASHGDAAAATSQVDAAARQWSALRSDVVDHDGASVAAAADDTIQAMTVAAAARDLASLTSHATALLEIVDQMERLY